MKRILFVIGTLDNGGAERVVSLLAGELSRRGYEVSIITIINNKINYKLKEGVKVVQLDLKGSGIKRNFNRISALRKEIKKNDVIISFLAIINMATLLAGIGLRKRIIMSERNDPAREPGNRHVRVIRNLMYKYFHCNCFVFQTNDACNYFPNSIKKKSTIIPNPIIELPEPFKGDRKKNIVTIARLEPQKNLKLLLKCFATVSRKYPDYSLDIYGRGPQLNELQEYARTLKMQGKVNFHGFVKNVHEEIKDAGIYVMSSDYEGISNGMLEALGLGLPVIATDCPIGGARMFIQNNVNGLLVPVGNEKKLTEAIFKLIEEPELRKKIGNSALDVRSKLNLQHIITLWERIIEEDK